MDPISLHKNLNTLKKKKIDHVILEASSHGLKQKRLDGLKIKIGVFTNLSHDHLDYHKNKKSYLNSKMYLFKKLLKKKAKIITDEEIKEYKIIKKIAKKREITQFTIGTNKGNIKIISNFYKKNKQIVKVLFNSKIFILEIPLIGDFQLKNLFMAVLAASNFGISIPKILNQLNKIKPVSARLECVAKLKNNSMIIVDFAHTPEALEKILSSLKKQFRKEIILVFGCGGERDKKKRFTMGNIASKYCRKIFVTDDNPRNENPKKIRKSIIKACKTLAVDIGSRKKAIETGIMELRSNEILLVAGKGHEQTQNYGNKILNFSDKRVIKNIIFKKKFHLGKNTFKKDILKKTFLKNDIENMNYQGVSINTKILKKNNLFFAIKGKKNDGHNFVNLAIKKGAIKAVVNNKTNKFPHRKIIKVKNTFSSLNALAKATREISSAKIIGITGSVGKTTLKNLISFALKNYGNVYHSPYSYNNKFGVPLSLSNLKDSTEYGVFEIGMDKKGEIDKLSKIVKPEIGVITNISGAHFKNFRTLKDIAKAKSEIINNIEYDGNIILNKDDNFYNFFLKKANAKGLNVISFSLKKNSDIQFLKTIKIKNYYKIKICVINKIFYFYVKNFTDSFKSNILACVSVLYALNLDLKKVKNIFLNFKIPSGRGDLKIVKQFGRKFKFIDESYNANPLSMKSAINNMNYYKRNKNMKKIAFLGDMLELGKKSKKLHKGLSPIINKSDIDKVFVFGKHIMETFKSLNPSKKGKSFNNLSEAHDYFSKIIHNNDLLMVKGSNATGLNEFSKNIKKGKYNVV